ncbi:hypothetical protein [Massilia sp. YIM B04103]|uniref:hypothetical protein n=1 Tax=Massilia sp. YIM B04103 TaxID=2963106 RepID=UPI0021094548|nr:hypothetical protein [Massilia sp. YIM B04103]
MRKKALLFVFAAAAALSASFAGAEDRPACLRACMDAYFACLEHGGTQEQVCDEASIACRRNCR